MSVTREFRAYLTDESDGKTPTEYCELECEATFELGPAADVEIAHVAVYYGTEMIEIGSGAVAWPAVMAGAEDALAEDEGEILGELLREAMESDFPGSDIPQAHHDAVRDYFAVPDRPITLAAE